MRYQGRIGALGLALVAMLLFSASAAGAASAAEFKANPAFPVNFTGSGKVGLLETKAGRSVTCTETKVANGAVVNAKEATATVVFDGCFAEHLPLLTCQSGSVSGQIVANVKATPIDLNAAHTEAGLLLEPASGTQFVSFHCALGPVNEELIVTGSIIGKVPTAQLNEFRSTLTLEFKATLGSQEYTQVEGAGARHVLMTEGKGTEPFAAEESGISEAVPGTTTLTAEEGQKVELVP
ncbi:MAG: hypothetical protein ACM3JL_00035 [Nitrososphaerota archaeon]